MADMMKIKFKTKVNAGGGVEPAGKIHTLSVEKAKAYIERGLAVEVKVEAKPEGKKSDKKPEE